MLKSSLLVVRRAFVETGCFPYATLYKKGTLSAVLPAKRVPVSPLKSFCLNCGFIVRLYHNLTEFIFNIHVFNHTVILYSRRIMFLAVLLNLCGNGCDFGKNENKYKRNKKCDEKTTDQHYRQFHHLLFFLKATVYAS